MVIPAPAALNGNGHRALLLNKEEFEARLQQQVLNATSMRAEFLRRYMSIDGPNRNLNSDCGYPEGSVVDPWYFRDLYDREPVATRVVELMPKECWQVQPEVYEDEDVESDTPFEEAWDNLSKELRGDGSWFQDAEGSPVWEYLFRADKLSGIGQFGVILFGLDDGRPLYEPVEGMVSRVPTGNNQHAVSKPRVDESELKLAEKLGQELTINVSNANPSSGAMVMKDGQPQPIASLSTQFLGVQYVPPEYPATKPRTKETKLVFLRPFDQSSVQVTQWEANILSPRFGQPIMYRVTLNDYRDQHTGIGVPMATVQVHWTRVLHVADNLNSSEVVGVPRIRPVLNPVLDIRKVRGASAEGFWKGGFPGISLETHPQLGGDVMVDDNTIRDMMEHYQNGLQRYLLNVGMSAKMLAPAIADPTPFINVLVEAVCIQLGCPVRVFRGSERGELASSQDDSSWNDRIRHRQNGYVTPRLIVPFVDRLIMLAVLPIPQPKAPKKVIENARRRGAVIKRDSSGNVYVFNANGKPVSVSSVKGGYSVRWPDLDSLGDKDKAAIALQETQAVTAFVGGGGENFMSPKDFWVEIMGRDEEKAEALVQGAMDHQEEQLDMHGDMADQGEEHDLVPTPPPGFEAKPPEPPPMPGMSGGPPTPPVKLGGGQNLVHPETGKTVAKGSPLPKPPTKNAAFGEEFWERHVEDWPLVFNQEERDGVTENCGGEGSGVPGPCAGSHHEAIKAAMSKGSVEEVRAAVGKLSGESKDEVAKVAENLGFYVAPGKSKKAMIELIGGNSEGIASSVARSRIISAQNTAAVENCGGEGSGVPGPCPSASSQESDGHLEKLKAISDDFTKGSGERGWMRDEVDKVLSSLTKEQLKEAAAKFGSRSAKGRAERVEGIKRFISDRREMLQRATRNSNPKGCNQYKSCGEALKDHNVRSYDVDTYPREEAAKMVESLKALSKEDILVAAKEAGIRTFTKSKKGILEEIHRNLTAGHRARDMIFG